MTEHWTTRFIGLPYAKGGNSTAGFNCWFFAGYVALEQFGYTLPEIPLPDEGDLLKVARMFRDQVDRSGWVKVAETEPGGRIKALLDRPRSGDASLMAHLRHPSHVGIYVDDVARGSVLHCVEGAGSSLPSLFHLKSACWRITGFYRPGAV